jgi:hypothetical protein
MTILKRLRKSAAARMATVRPGRRCEMKWKALIAAALMAAVAGSTHAEVRTWQLGTIAPGGAWAYSGSDAKTLLFATRLVTQVRLNDGGGYSGMITNLELDCAGGRIRAVEVAHYEADGSLIDDNKDIGDWQTVVPAASGYGLGNLVADRCAGKAPPSAASFSGDETAMQTWLAGLLAKNASGS